MKRRQPPAVQAALWFEWARPLLAAGLAISVLALLVLAPWWGVGLGLASILAVDWRGWE